MSTITKPIVLNETFSSKMDSLIAKFGRKTLTITCTSDDGTAVTNQTIKVYEASSGTLFGTFVYNAPTSLTIDMPDGFNYKIVAECTLANHFVSDVPTGIITQATTVTLTYKSLGNLATFPDIKSALNAGLGSQIPIGTEVSFTHTTYGSLTYEVVDYDSNTDTITLLQEDCLDPQIQFDAPEALYKATDGLAIGDYTFKNGSTSYYFSLTSAIPSGGQLRATTSQFFTYASPSSSTTIETGTVSTTAISGATDLGTCGSGLLNNMDRVNNGSNDYGESAIRQWLNATTSDWWQAQTMFDRPSANAGLLGFKAGVPSSVLNVLDTASVKCVAQNSYCAPDSSHTKGSTYTCNDVFYLASQMEVFGTADFPDGSTIFNYYIGATDSQRIKKYGTSARGWWLRSPYSNTYSEYIVRNSGSSYSNTANSSNSVVVACQISKSSE